MTKMTTTPIYGKNPLKSSSLESEGRRLLDLVCSIEDVDPIKFYLVDGPRSSLTDLTLISNLLLRGLVKNN